MSRTKKTCDVTGITTNIKHFYNNQSHLKCVDNLRRGSNATKVQIGTFFNQLKTI